MSDVPLKEYIEAHLHAHEKEHGLIAESVERSRLAMERRLDSMNELRAQITTERAQMATKEWVGSRIEYMEGHILETRKGSKTAILVAVISAMASIAVAAIALLKVAR